MSHLPPLHPFHPPAPIRCPTERFPLTDSYEQRLTKVVERWTALGTPGTAYWDHSQRELMCHKTGDSHLFVPGEEIYKGLEAPSPKEGSTIQSKTGFMIDLTTLASTKVIYLLPTDEPVYHASGQKELETRARTPSDLYRDASPLLESPPDWILHISGEPILVYRDTGQLDGFAYGMHIPDYETPAMRLTFFSIAMEMVSALQLLHSKGLAHTDVSIENFLIVDRTGGLKGAKLIDIYHVLPATPELIQKDIFDLGVALLKEYRLHPLSLPGLEYLLSEIIGLPAEQLSRPTLESWEDAQWEALRKKPPSSTHGLADILSRLDSLRTYPI